MKKVLFDIIHFSILYPTSNYNIQKWKTLELSTQYLRSAFQIGQARKNNRKTSQYILHLHFSKALGLANMVFAIEFLMETMT
jgi:hypothetical protein